ncbi:hypothetical protein SAMN02744775_04447 [Enterobacter sp. CC120223-11]|nr:hypothetical protein SAMN02744775_04447 [Enterobacter sp. CC120223-11]
MYFLPDKGG